MIPLAVLCCAAAVPAPTDTELLAPLLPPPAAVAGEALAAGADAQTHAVALRRDPLHGQSYWLRSVQGDPKARRVVFLIPQYHHDAVTPIAWTSLGAEISAVQGNIDQLVTRLVRAHGLTCIGTEGSPWSRITRSSALHRLAWWRHQLDRARAATLEDLREEGALAEKQLGAVVDLLSGSIAQHIPYLDGVGVAQARLGEEEKLVRFGLEEQETNQEAMALLAQLKEVEEAMAKLDTGSQPTGAGVVGQMWLDEYPAYEAETLLPLARAMTELDELRRELRSDRLERKQRALMMFITLARRVAASVIQPEEVAATIAYYREVEQLARDEQTSGRRLTAAEQREFARLEKRHLEVSARYAAVTKRRREQVAAEKLIARMNHSQKGHRHCALVMGAGHEDGLIEALRVASNGSNLGGLAILVIAPFSFE